MQDSATSGERDRLIVLLSEVEKDLATFKRMQLVLAQRVDEVKIKQLSGEHTTELLEFSGTTAVRGTLALSVLHLELTIEAIKTQIGELTLNEGLVLVRKEGEA